MSKIMSKLTINGNTYEIVDTTARQSNAQDRAFVLSGTTLFELKKPSFTVTESGVLRVNFQSSNIGEYEYKLTDSMYPKVNQYLANNVKRIYTLTEMESATPRVIGAYNIDGITFNENGTNMISYYGMTGIIEKIYGVDNI